MITISVAKIKWCIVLRSDLHQLLLKNLLRRKEVPNETALVMRYYVVVMFLGPVQNSI